MCIQTFCQIIYEIESSDNKTEINCATKNINEVKMVA